MSDELMAAPHAAFGARIRAILDRRGLTQLWLARECGLSTAFLSDVVRGKRSVSAETLERLADVLGVTMDELWRGLGRCDPADLPFAGGGTP